MKHAKFAVVMGLALSLAACASQSRKDLCAGHLVPINAPTPKPAAPEPVPGVAKADRP